MSSSFRTYLHNRSMDNMIRFLSQSGIRAVKPCGICIADILKDALTFVKYFPGGQDGGWSGLLKNSYPTFEIVRRRDRPPCLSCSSWLSFVRTGTEACPYRAIAPAPRGPPCRRPRNRLFQRPPAPAGRPGNPAQDRKLESIDPLGHNDLTLLHCCDRPGVMEFHRASRVAMLGIRNQFTTAPGTGGYAAAMSRRIARP